MFVFVAADHLDLKETCPVNGSHHIAPALPTFSDGIDAVGDNYVAELEVRRRYGKGHDVAGGADLLVKSKMLLERVLNLVNANIGKPIVWRPTPSRSLSCRCRAIR